MFKRFLLGALLALASLSASADWILTQGANSVTVRETPCVGPASKWIKPEHLAKFKEAVIQVEGHTYGACAAQIGPQVFVVDVEGDTFTLPSAEFRKLKEV